MARVGVRGLTAGCPDRPSANDRGYRRCGLRSRGRVARSWASRISFIALVVDIPARGRNLVSRPYFTIYYQPVADFGDQVPPAIGYVVCRTDGPAHTDRSQGPHSEPPRTTVAHEGVWPSTERPMGQQRGSTSGLRRRRCPFGVGSSGRRRSPSGFPTFLARTLCPTAVLGALRVRPCGRTSAHRPRRREGRINNQRHKSLLQTIHRVPNLDPCHDNRGAR